MREEIFNTTKPDYEGTDSPIYGSITPASQTDSSGIAKSIYTAGTEPGFIEFWYEERSIKESKRGSWLWDWFTQEKGEKKEKLKLRVYVGELPDGCEPPLHLEGEGGVMYYIKESFKFLVSKNRFEFVNKKFTECKDNEFNVLCQDEKGFPGEMGKYEGNCSCYVNYLKILHHYDDRYCERAGRTAAHEIGHSISHFHHPKCIMVRNITDLPDKCQHFCEKCKKKWWKILGGE